MGQRNGRSADAFRGTRERDAYHFARRASGWIRCNEALLDALVALRGLDDDGAAEAVEAVLEIKRIKQFRLGWELAVALADGERRNPYAELSQVLSVDALRRVEIALWGDA